MTESSSSGSFREGAVFALASVGLMIVGFALAAFSTVYVFKNGSGFLTAVFSLVVPGVFLAHAFVTKFPSVGRDWNALFAFTVGGYALCLAPIVINYLLAIILAVLHV